LPPEQQDVENIKKVDSLLEYKVYRAQQGDTVRSGKFSIVLDSITLNSKNKGYTAQENDLAIAGNFTIMHEDADSSKQAYPTLLVRKGLLYGMSDQVNDYNVRIRLRPTSIDTLVPSDENLKYEPLVLHPSETQTWHGLTFTLEGIDKNAAHPSYTSAEGDIAFNAVLQITDKRGKRHIARPLYLIREGRPFNLKAYLPNLGLHVRLERIEPNKEEFNFFVAQPFEDQKITFEFAEEVPRNDYIVLEAILFPGINLFWAGTMIMLGGMFLGMYKRLRRK
ncbi:MAG: hypothetical protein M3R25_11725, partial [Bacteroidota bacterium]|nr:hypothetical protein [Bacteroidota bacterium]